MSELILRAGHNDHRVIEQLLTDPTALPTRSASHMKRVVVEAPAAASTTVYASAARDSGVQLLIDPMTHLLTSEQDPEDSWARLPFTGGPSPRPVAEFKHASDRAQLIEEVVEFQLDHGATAIIPPYLHLEEPSGTAAAVVQRFVRETADYVHSDLGMEIPIFPILSVDRTGVPLDRTAWQAGMGKLLRTMTHRANGGPFALALSGSASRANTTNLHVRTRIWRRTAAVGPFIAWGCGDLGLLAVAMGAAGYSTGMCTGERYNAPGSARNRAPGTKEPGPRHVGAYVDLLGVSLGLGAVRELVDLGPATLRGDLSCLDPTCCRQGITTMLEGGRRQHAARRRLADLDDLDAIGARGWRLHHLQTRAAAAGHAATRIRAAADKHGIRVGAYPGDYAAVEQVVVGLRETARMAIA